MDWNTILDASKVVAPALAQFIVGAVAVIVGLWFIIAGVLKMVNQSRPGYSGNPSMAPVLGNLLIGALFLQFSRTVSLVSEAVFGTTEISTASSAMAYVPSPLKQSELMTTAIEVVLIWIVLLGIVAIFRGFLIANALAEGKGQSNKSGWSVFWHLVGGIALVNIAKTLEIITSNAS